MSQKEAFLEHEGNAWFQRNSEALARRRLPDEDAVLLELLELDDEELRGRDVLEVGCGDARRLDWLRRERDCRCVGVEPSGKAVDAARERGLEVKQGTADALPFPDASMDILIFGFCLYLCDRSDLARVVAEADRVLRTPGWIVIEDFFSREPRAREYHHLAGIWTYKMDYRTLFAGYPQYECLTHRIRHHQTRRYTDDREEWVAVSVLRKLA